VAMFVRERTVRMMASAWLASTAPVVTTMLYKGCRETNNDSSSYITTLTLNTSKTSLTLISRTPAFTISSEHKRFLFLVSLNIF